AGPRYPRRWKGPAPVALADNSRRVSGYSRTPVATTDLPTPPPPPTRYAAQEPRKGGFRLIAPAVADTMPLRMGGPATGAWAVQVGAFASQGLARSAAQGAQAVAGGRVMVGTVQQNRTVLYRA